MGRVDNKIALITGVSSGIGRAVALRYGLEGAKTVIGDINFEEGKATADSICSAGGEATFIQTDISQQDQVKAMIELAMNKYGRIDILVNCAGILGIKAPWEEHSIELCNKVLGTNFMGPVYFMKDVLPIMQKQGYGSVVNVCSVSSIKAEPNTYFYGAGKAALWMLTKCLVLEYSPHGVRLNCILPGPIETNLTPQRPGVTPEMRAEALKTIIPIGRAGQPEEVASLALFLGSDESSYISGATIAIDGGLQ